jgi:REP element-mobilizing transposase RayT
MLRLRRLVLSDRFFFITCRLQPGRRMLSDSALACLVCVIGDRRRKHRFLLTPWFFLHDHWHAILFPRHPLSISVVMESIKVGST